LSPLLAGVSQPDSLTGLEEAVISLAGKTAPAILAVKSSCPRYIMGGTHGAPAVFEDFISTHFSELMSSGPLSHFFSFTGFIVSDDGLVVTSIRAASGSSAPVLHTQNGEEYPSSVEAIDPVNRIALLKIQVRKKFPFLELSDSVKVFPGQFVITLCSSAEQGAGVSFGVVSRVIQPSGIIYTDAFSGIEGCGGPLINIRGKLVGVISGSSGNAFSELAGQPFSTAAPASAVKSLIDRYLEKKKSAANPPQPSSRAEQDVLKLADFGIVIALDNNGLYIKEIEHGSAASFSNIIPGMRLDSVNKTRVSSFKDVIDALRLSPERILLHIEDGDSRYFVVLSR